MVKDTSEYEYRKKNSGSRKKEIRMHACKRFVFLEQIKVTGYLPMCGGPGVQGTLVGGEKHAPQGWHLHRYTPRGLYYQRGLTRSAAPTGGSAETV